MIMDADTEKALRDSIVHWERLATGTRNPGESIHPDDCALCRRFLSGRSAESRGGDLSCGACPVKQRSGRDFCANTPWFAASATVIEWTDDVGLNSAEFRTAAQAELDFLRSLLPDA